MNAPEFYADAGRKAGRAMRAHDAALLRQWSELVNRALRLEAEPYRSEMRKLYDLEYSAYRKDVSRNPARKSMKTVKRKLGRKTPGRPPTAAGRIRRKKQAAKLHPEKVAKRAVKRNPAPYRYLVSVGGTKVARFLTKTHAIQYARGLANAVRKAVRVTAP
jgi:hypothetical protein